MPSLILHYQNSGGNGRVTFGNIGRSKNQGLLYMPTRGINVEMDTGTRAFNCSLANLTDVHTYDYFNHSLIAPAVYTLVTPLMKQHRYHFVLLEPNALTAYCVGRLT